MTTAQPKRRELSAMLRAARTTDERHPVIHPRIGGMIVLGLAAAVIAVSSEQSLGIHHGATRRPFLLTHGSSTESAQGEFQMNAMLIQSAAVASAFAVSSAALAQTAVQWRVEDGGNGHWYAVTSESLVHPQLRSACEARGGHLATLTSQAEWQWVKTNLPVTGLFVGGYQDRSSPSYAEPNGGWKWVTGEPFVLNIAYMGTNDIFCTMTVPGFDDCPAGTCGYCGCGTPGAQDALFFTGCCNNVLDDVGDGVVQNCDSVARAGIIEWSADCNNDGIVDYGQIRGGTLADSNGDNVPDVCDPGFVMSWGSNDYGESAVPSSLGLVRAVDAGSYHSVALRVNGTVVCWGAGATASGVYPHFGQSQVPAGLSSVQDVAAAGMHTVALRSNGSISCWGSNDYGQSAPPADLGVVQAIAAGFAHTVALLPDGSVRCWGRNTWGECSVPSGLTGVAGISAGDTHVIVRKLDGSVVAWGNNFYGQLNSPQGLPALASVRSKGNHNVGRTALGDVWCWGYNSAGQCTIPSLLGPVDFASPGGLHTVAVRRIGTLACWGSNTHGQCNVPSAAAHVLRAVGGDRHTVAIVSLPDADQDGIPDGNDNCASIANADQADCNGNGIGDVCEIAAGALTDANHNNIPDCCENGATCDPCQADVDQSGAVNGVDLAAVLNNWGTSGGKQPRSDINQDGVVDGADLAECLNAWGPCR